MRILLCVGLIGVAMTCAAQAADFIVVKDTTAAVAEIQRLVCGVAPDCAIVAHCTKPEGLMFTLDEKTFSVSADPMDEYLIDTGKIGRVDKFTSLDLSRSAEPIPPWKQGLANFAYSHLLASVLICLHEHAVEGTNYPLLPGKPSG